MNHSNAVQTSESYIIKKDIATYKLTTNLLNIKAYTLLKPKLTDNQPKNGSN